MNSLSKLRITVRHIFGAALLFFASATALVAASTEFSRSAQLARLMDHIHFSGGVLPAGEIRGEYLHLEAVPLPTQVDRRTRKPVRVSHDLLGMENTQQPGYQAEPYIHANPFDSNHLVAGWQENRFMDGGAQALNVAVNRHSEVAVSYYSLQNDPSLASLVDSYVVLSNARGESFGQAVRATRRTFDIRLAALAGPSFFLGDYVGLTGSNRHFHLLWVGTKRRSPTLGMRQPDVFTNMTR